MSSNEAPDGQFWLANFVRTGKVSVTWTGRLRTHLNQRYLPDVGQRN